MIISTVYLPGNTANVQHSREGNSVDSCAHRLPAMANRKQAAVPAFQYCSVTGGCISNSR